MYKKNGNSGIRAAKTREPRAHALLESRSRFSTRTLLSFVSATSCCNCGFGKFSITDMNCLVYSCMEAVSISVGSQSTL